MVGRAAHVDDQRKIAAGTENAPDFVQRAIRAFNVIEGIDAVHRIHAVIQQRDLLGLAGQHGDVS